MIEFVVVGMDEHAERVIDAVARSQSHRVAGVASFDAARVGSRFVQHEVLSLETVRERKLPVLVCGGTGHVNQDRLSSYMAAKRAGCRVLGVAARSAQLPADMKLRENVYIDSHVNVLPGANIGANCWVHAGSEIGSGARLASSCWVGPGCVIGEGASIGKNCELGAGVIVGAGVSLPAWSVVRERVHLKESPSTPIYVDSLFRARVTLHGL